jgi:TetR/AcrR family transcriptional repressor of nem operon
MYLVRMPRPRSFDEEAVLDRAVQLFRERGFEGTSLADLETRLRVGRQSLYNTFGDKQALYLKALERYREQTGDILLAPLRAPDAGLDAVRRWLEAHVAALTAPGVRAGCLVVNSLVERPDDPATASRCAEARRGTTAAVRSALERARKRGELGARRDVDALATLLVAHAYGLAVLARAGATAAELRAASEAALAALD